MTMKIDQSILSPLGLLDSGSRHLNLWWQGTLFMVGLFVITLILWGLDPRQLDGVSVWAKPLKFASSLALYFITLALLAGFLPAETRSKASWRWATRLGVTAGIFEVVYILLQAARGRASHYNFETVIENAMYGLMGVFALVLVAVSFYLGLLLYRDYRKEKQDIFKLSAACGLMLGSVLTLVIAGVMSSALTSHFAGTPAADAWIVPIMGWSLSGGDLRIPHFFATHLMQFLPLYGLWLQRQAVAVDVGRRKVLMASWGYTLVVLVCFAASFAV